MTRRDLAAALHHVARLAGPEADPHRLALEAILLRALAAAECVGPPPSNAPAGATLH